MGDVNGQELDLGLAIAGVVSLLGPKAVPEAVIGALEADRAASGRVGQGGAVGVGGAGSVVPSDPGLTGRGCQGAAGLADGHFQGRLEGAVKATVPRLNGLEAVIFVAFRAVETEAAGTGDWATIGLGGTVDLGAELEPLPGAGPTAVGGRLELTIAFSDRDLKQVDLGLTIGRPVPGPGPEAVPVLVVGAGQDNRAAGLGVGQGGAGWVGGRGGVVPSAGLAGGGRQGAARLADGHTQQIDQGPAIGRLTPALGPKTVPVSLVVFGQGDPGAGLGVGQRGAAGLGLTLGPGPGTGPGWRWPSRTRGRRGRRPRSYYHSGHHPGGPRQPGPDH